MAQSGFVVLFGLLFFGALLLFAWIFHNVSASRRGILRVTWIEKLTVGLVLLVVATGGAALVLSGDSGPGGRAPYVALAFFTAVAVVFVMIMITKRRQARAQRARDAESRALFEQIRGGQPLTRPLFVYLRPFSAGEHGTPGEEFVIELFERHGTLICVAEQGFKIGMGRLTLKDDEWQAAVLALCERATAIVIHPAANPGTFWELTQIVGRGWLDRTFFFMPLNLPGQRALKALTALATRADPEHRAEIDRLEQRNFWEPARARAREIGVELPEYRDQGGVFRITAGQVEWLGQFDRGYVIGKPVTGAFALLTTHLEELLADQRSGHHDEPTSAATRASMPV